MLTNIGGKQVEHKCMKESQTRIMKCGVLASSICYQNMEHDKFCYVLSV